MRKKTLGSGVGYYDLVASRKQLAHSNAECGLRNLNKKSNSLAPILPVSYRHVNLNYYTGPLERLPYPQ